jgi:hypothetical protein
MSWEHSKYEARCTACGKKGLVIRSSDDWGRSSTKYVGFENERPDATAVGRKRADARDNSGRCDCGSGSIDLGAFIE